MYSRFFQKVINESPNAVSNEENANDQENIFDSVTESKHKTDYDGKYRENGF